MTWLKITTTDDGVVRKMRQKVYIMDDDNNDTYLSYEALTILGQIRRNWNHDGDRQEKTAAATAAATVATAAEATAAAVAATATVADDPCCG